MSGLAEWDRVAGQMFGGAPRRRRPSRPKCPSCGRSPHTPAHEMHGCDWQHVTGQTDPRVTAPVEGRA